MRNELWQGCFGYWQNQFIHHNILVIGYTAWIGYLNEGRGMVVCEVVDAISSSIDWSIDTITFNRAFISQVHLARYMQALDLGEETVTALLNAIATYDPAQAIVLLLISNGEVEINLLHHLATSPADCFAQVQHRWAEFQPDLTPQRRHS